MIDKIIELEPREYSILKLVEECAELSEASIKILTKPKGAMNPERLNHLIEELGDVNARISIVARHLEITQDVANRRQSKLAETLEACKKRYGTIKETI